MNEYTCNSWCPRRDVSEIQNSSIPPPPPYILLTESGKYEQLNKFSLTSRGSQDHKLQR